eukprot:6882710-Prymnesium_polylepis.2
MSALDIMQRFESHGEVRAVRGAVRGGEGARDGGGTGHAWVRFDAAEAAAEALRVVNSTIVGERYLQVWRADSRPSRQAARQQQRAADERRRADSRGPQTDYRGAARGGRRGARPEVQGTGRVFVHGIPHGVGTPDLLDAFLACGDVVRVSWPRASPDAPSLCAVLEFASADGALHAVYAMQRPMVGGKAVGV